MIIRNTILEFVFHNAYIVIWAYILAILLAGKSDTKMVKYKQRSAPSDILSDDSEKEKVKIEYEDATNRLSRYEKGIKYSLIVSGIFAPVWIFLHFFFGSFIINIEIFPIAFMLSTFMLTYRSYSVSKLFKYFLYVLSFLYAVSVFIFYFYGKTYFVDMCVVIFTLLSFLISIKYNYQNRITMVLLGVNLLFLNEKYFSFEDYQIYYNIILSVSTGILASAIIMMFTDYDNKIKNRKMRAFYLNNISFSIETSLESIYQEMYAEDNSKHFSYVVYDEFKYGFEALCGENYEKINSVFEKPVITSFDTCLGEMRELLKNKSNLELNNIVDGFEIIAIAEFMYYCQNCIRLLEENNICDYQKSIVKLFSKIEQLAGEVPEIKDMLNEVGKRKLVIHREVGTLKQVWSDGSKVTNEDYLP